MQGNALHIEVKLHSFLPLILCKCPKLKEVTILSLI